MTTAALLEHKIGLARMRVNAAESALDAQVGIMVASHGGEKTIVAQLLECAFQSLRDAKGDLLELLQRVEGKSRS
jgi:hypothetical protein